MNILGRPNRASKTVLAGIISAILFLLPLISFGQIGPDCSDIDPINAYCPLDTWVIILAFIAVIFTAIYLQRKQKTLKLTAKGF
jgi:membrane protease YdiL (CAAX protease family)